MLLAVAVGEATFSSAGGPVESAIMKADAAASPRTKRMIRPEELIQVSEAARTLRHNIGQVMVGKEEVIDLLLVALLCEGHVLFEDVPGTGKTTLARSLACSLACSFQRIQFTPDLLPSDITGITFFNQKQGTFEFRP